jgi:hypothetical protein
MTEGHIADDEDVLRRRLADMAVMALGEVTTGAAYGLYHKSFREHFVARLDRAFAYKPLAAHAEAVADDVGDGAVLTRLARVRFPKAPEGLSGERALRRSLAWMQTERGEVRMTFDRLIAALLESGVTHHALARSLPPDEDGLREFERTYGRVWADRFREASRRAALGAAPVEDET